MKNLLILFLLFFFNNTFAQSAKAPQKDFVVSLPTNAVEMTSSESQKIPFTILRSKGFTKSKASMSVASNLPIGLTINFEPAEGNFENGEVIVTTQGTPSGNYNIILNATLSNKKKGSILSVQVK